MVITTVKNQIDPMVQRISFDKACRYLRVSHVFFQRFVEDYNSIEPGKVTLSFAHLYKAWDSLYQSMLIYSGEKIRKKNTNGIPNKHPLGNVTGLSETLFQSRKKFNSSNWAISFFREAYDNINDKKEFSSEYNKKLFKSLDLLKTLRNASEHDFLEVSQGSYNSLVTRCNKYIIPIAEAYLKIYEDYYPLVMARCNFRSSKKTSVEDKKPFAGCDEGRNNNCERAKLKLATYENLKDTLHFPLPFHFVAVNAAERKGSVDAILNKILPEESREGKEILTDEKWSLVDISKQKIESELSEKFIYRTVSQVTEILNAKLELSGSSQMSRARINYRLNKNDFKNNCNYMLELKYSFKGKKRTNRLYSVALLEELVKLYNQNPTTF